MPLFFKNNCSKIILLFIAVFFIQSCKNDMQKVNALLNKSELDTDKADSVTIYYSSNGLVKAKLQSKTFINMQTARPSYILMKDGLKVTFYDEKNNISNILTAQNGRYYQEINDVIVKDSVVITNSKKEELKTEELIWNEKTQLFHTTRFVTITTPTQIIYGDGMESNQNFSNYKIINVKGIIQVNKNKY